MVEMCEGMVLVAALRYIQTVIMNLLSSEGKLFHVVMIGRASSNPVPRFFSSFFIIITLEKWASLEHYERGL